MARRSPKSRKRKGPEIVSQAYRKGQSLKIRTTEDGHVPLPGVVTTPTEVHQQYQLLLGVQQEARRLLREAQAMNRKWEKREHLLVLVTSLDEVITKLETSLGRLSEMAARFAVFGANSREAIVTEAHKFV